jgi:hypothetical protein
MGAARTSETPVNIDLATRQHIPEDSELHTRRRENLKSHTLTTMFQVHMLGPCSVDGGERMFMIGVYISLFVS